MRLCTMALTFKERMWPWFLGSCVWPESRLQVFVNRVAMGCDHALFCRTESGCCLWSVYFL